jgi:hypothetical protein
MAPSASRPLALTLLGGAAVLAPEPLRRLDGDPLMAAEVEARLMEGRPKLHSLGEVLDEIAARKSRAARGGR